MGNEVVRTACDLCGVRCGVLVHVSDGKPLRIEGDPECPIMGGGLCIKGVGSLEWFNNPNRLKYPLKRIGERGDGKYQRISWDEALDIVAAELSRIKGKYGAEAVAFNRGSHKGYSDFWGVRFANLFGSPNICNVRHLCDFPRSAAGVVSTGFAPLCDYRSTPACIVSWATNVKDSRPDQYRDTIAALKRGSKLIVINPKAIELAQMADHFLQLRPGTDLLLALAMANVIINEELYDVDFVEKWTFGFNELKAHVQAYPPEKVSEMTWLDAEKIKAVARFYATSKPACINWGNGIEHNLNASQTGRAITILRGVTGNFDIPGGDVQFVAPAIVDPYSKEVTCSDKLPEAQREKAIGREFKLVSTAKETVQTKVFEAMATGKPYPVRGLVSVGFNALLNGGNTPLHYKALKKVEFSVEIELFMTPSAAMADIVLPANSYFEHDGIVLNPGHNIIRVQQKVGQIGESRSDYDIFQGLAKKIGLGEYFWDTEEQMLDFLLKPVGITFNEFRKVAKIIATQTYRKYEANGFNTPSRKMELYSNRFKEWGFDPLPVYHEAPETDLSQPKLAKEYPLYYITSKAREFRGASGKQLPTMRTLHPDPLVKMHPETASNLGIKQGDWVYIETKRGRIKEKAELTDTLDPRVVEIDHGWWFPEKGIEEMFDWKSSNINMLTTHEHPSAELGTLNLRGMLCKISKVT